jgi:hypothetical protein
VPVFLRLEEPEELRLDFDPAELRLDFDPAELPPDLARDEVPPDFEPDELRLEPELRPDDALRLAPLRLEDDPLDAPLRLFADELRPDPDDEERRRLDDALDPLDPDPLLRRVELPDPLRLREDEDADAVRLAPFSSSFIIT